MSLNANIEIITQSDIVEERLEPYRSAIGGDLDAYRGHIYRVLTYALHFLLGVVAVHKTIAAQGASAAFLVYSNYELSLRKEI